MNAALPQIDGTQNSIAPVWDTAYEILEKVIAVGDLSRLSSKERVEYYSNICKSLDLNPLTRPFEFIKFDGKLTLYARKDCTEQLRSKWKISIVKIDTKVIQDVFIYTCYGRTPCGREDVGTGAVAIKGLIGKQLANAYKIAETQAKRRMTLSICGLSFCDESELPDVPNVQPIKMDYQTGEIQEEKVIKNPTTLNTPRQDLIQAVLDAKNLNDLKIAYSNAYLAHLGDMQLLNDLGDLKDKRKIELCESTIDKLKKEAEIKLEEKLNDNTNGVIINDNS